MRLCFCILSASWMSLTRVTCGIQARCRLAVTVGSPSPALGPDVCLGVRPGDAGEVPNADAWGCQPGQPPNLARFAVELDQRFLTELAHTTVLFNELFDQSGRKQLIKVRHHWEGICSRDTLQLSRFAIVTGMHGIWPPLRASDLRRERLPWHLSSILRRSEAIGLHPCTP